MYHAAGIFNYNILYRIIEVLKRCLTMIFQYHTTMVKPVGDNGETGRGLINTIHVHVEPCVIFAHLICKRFFFS